MWRIEFSKSSLFTSLFLSGIHKLLPKCTAWMQRPWFSSKQQCDAYCSTNRWVLKNSFLKRLILHLQIKNSITLVFSTALFYWCTWHLLAFLIFMPLHRTFCKFFQLPAILAIYFCSSSVIVTQFRENCSLNKDKDITEKTKAMLKNAEKKN